MFIYLGVKEEIKGHMPTFTAFWEEMMQSLIL